MKKPKIWYSFYSRGKYAGTEPAFVDAKDFTWVKLMEDAFPAIRKDLEKLITQEDAAFKPYFLRSAVEKKASWKTFSFRWWGLEFKKHQRSYPETAKVIQGIPGLVSASFSKLEAGATIQPHQGDTNAIYRAHLGLVIPASLPQCGFQVLEEQQSWKEGGVLVFCDAHRHQAFNASEHDRYVLIIDVIRPEFLKHKRWICAGVMAALFIQKRLAHIRFFHSISPYWLAPFHFMARCAAWCVVPLRNGLSRS